MTLQFRHAPPAHLGDFSLVQDGHDQWHRYIAETLDDAVANLATLRLTDVAGNPVAPQFFSPTRFDPGQACIALPVRWNAFPRSLLQRFGRDKAMVVADMLWPERAGDDFDPLSVRGQVTMATTTDWVRPQDEYCEWRVERDPATGRIQRVVFTAEPPEVWMALHGGDLPMLRSTRVPWQPQFRFNGNPQVAARLYSDLLDHPVDSADLADATGKYNPFNRWNTTHGIVHLTHRVNTLNAAVQLCADSTLAYCHHPDGQSITQPEALCCSQPVGDPNNHSDPTVIGTVQALARGGAWLTLADPVEVVIEDVDTSGWSLPGVRDPRSLVRIVRGSPGQILRLVVQAPADAPQQLDRLQIAGEPLLHGGQIAECITVRTTLACTPAGKAPQAAPRTATSRGALTDANRRLLRVLRSGDPLGPGLLPAFAPPPEPAAKDNPPGAGA